MKKTLLPCGLEGVLRLANCEAGIAFTSNEVSASLAREISNSNTLEVVMWSKPEYTEMRFGFEVTMYIANR
ncbi:MAG: pyrroloquinoline quinone precursor peptide PqqA [Betaproteobacteria bacterium]|nr:pyrroloquinoline quinone precursor peptide PqqA [Betaproteobacteria bacterium]